MNGEEPTFARLMQRLRDGDPGACDALYARYGDAIRRAVRRQLHDGLRTQFDSLDFVQDVWASFLALPPDRRSFADPDALGGFLAQVARNKVIEVYRRRFQTRARDIRRERPCRQAGGEPGVAGREPTPSQAAIAGERLDGLAQSLSAGHRAILERLREGYTHEEIAAMLGVNVRTVERVVRHLKDVCGM